MSEYKDIGLEQMRSQIGRFGITGAAQTLAIKHLSDGLKSRWAGLRLSTCCRHAPGMHEQASVPMECFTSMHLMHTAASPYSLSKTRIILFTAVFISPFT
jgi:hypothetical protein